MQKLLSELVLALTMLQTTLAQVPVQSVPTVTNEVQVVTEVKVEVKEPEVVATPIVAEVITCESNWRNVTIIDTNGKHSRGIGQFQDSTWNMFSKESGIQGTSTDPVATIKMMNWAFENGKANHWTCYRMIKSAYGAKI